MLQGRRTGSRTYRSATVLRHLRAANAPVTSGELARQIIAECGADAAGVLTDTRARVRHNLDALARMGLARVVEERAARRGGARWEAIHNI